MEFPDYPRYWMGIFSKFLSLTKHILISVTALIRLYCKAPLNSRKWRYRNFIIIIVIIIIIIIITVLLLLLLILGCEQSLFCSRIRGKKDAKIREASSAHAPKTSVSRRARLAPGISCSLSFLRSSLRILEQKRDCSQSTSPCSPGNKESKPLSCDVRPLCLPRVRFVCIISAQATLIKGAVSRYF